MKPKKFSILHIFHSLSFVKLIHPPSVENKFRFIISFSFPFGSLAVCFNNSQQNLEWTEYIRSALSAGQRLAGIKLSNLFPSWIQAIVLHGIHGLVLVGFFFSDVKFCVARHILSVGRFRDKLKEVFGPDVSRDWDKIEKCKQK